MPFSVDPQNIDSIQRQLLEHGMNLGLVDDEGNPLPWQEAQKDKLALYPARWAYIEALLDLDIKPLLTEVDAQIEQIGRSPDANRCFAADYFFAADYKGTNTTTRLQKEYFGDKDPEAATKFAEMAEVRRAWNCREILYYTQTRKLEDFRKAELKGFVPGARQRAETNAMDAFIERIREKEEKGQLLTQDEQWLDQLIRLKDNADNLFSGLKFFVDTKDAIAPEEIAFRYSVVTTAVKAICSSLQELRKVRGVDAEQKAEDMPYAMLQNSRAREEILAQAKETFQKTPVPTNVEIAPVKKSNQLIAAIKRNKIKAAFIMGALIGVVTVLTMGLAGIGLGAAFAAVATASAVASASAVSTTSVVAGAVLTVAYAGFGATLLYGLFNLGKRIACCGQTSTVTPEVPSYPEDAPASSPVSQTLSARAQADRVATRAVFGGWHLPYQRKQAALVHTVTADDRDCKSSTRPRSIR